jgi:hypothetical protein
MIPLSPSANVKNRTLFFAVFLGSALLSVVLLALRRGDGFLGFFYQQGTNLLGDFTNNLHYPTHAGGPYYDSIWATFPPFAYTLYHLLGVCVTRAIPAAEIAVYLLLTGLMGALLLYGVQRVFQTYARAGGVQGVALAFALCVLASGVSLYALERGNSAYPVMVLLLYFLFLREGKARWQRELALLLLAVAAGMKIYPALFGLLYLLEKRWREAARLTLYGVLVFFVPFAWYGGVDGLLRYLDNLRQIQLLARNDFLTSIPSVLRFVAAETGWAGAATAGHIAACGFGALALAGVWLAPSLWQRCLLLVGIATLVPGWNAEYMALYFAVPAALLLAGGTGRKVEVVYAALLGGVFVLLPFSAGFTLHAPVSWNMLVAFGCIYALCLLALADVFTGAARRWRKARALG